MNDSSGFKIPIHQSCLRPKLIMGLPRIPVILLWTTMAAFVLGLRQLWMLPIGIALHVVLREVAKHDPYFFDVIKGSIKLPKRLRP